MKSDKTLSLYFFLIYLYTATPCDIFSISGLTRNIPMIVLPIIFTLYMCVRYKVNLYDKKLILFVGVLVLWNVIHLLYTPDFKISPFPFIEILVAYSVLKIYSKDIFIRYEKVTVFLSIIALIGWGLCLISHDFMLSLAKAVGSPGAGISQSLYIFSVPLSESNQGFILRNCGFSWEPGRFSCMILIALLFNLLRTKSDFKDKNFLILLAALISAQSTTGYVVFIILIAILYIKSKKINPIYIGLSILAVVLLFTLPFMREKIVNLYTSSQDMESQVLNLTYLSEQGGGDGYYVPQRFDGFMFQWMNLEHSRWLIGEGRDFTNFYINKHLGFQIATSEGLLLIIIQYGIILALFMYFMLWHSSKVLSKKLESKSSYLFFLMFLLLNFSYALWEVPLFMSFWMYGYFQDKSFAKI